jgi:DNA mismatch repair ATPase MutS
MEFNSILFHPSESAVKQGLPVAAPDFFGDLNLDQIAGAFTAGKEEYHLKPFFYAPLTTPDGIRYRHQVMQDIENEKLFNCIDTFAKNMRNIREQLAQLEKLYFKYQKERLFLDVVELYCDTVKNLMRDLSGFPLKSEGLKSFLDYLTKLGQSESFSNLVNEVRQITGNLATVQYCIYMRGLRVQVREYQGETDYSAEVDETFAKFKEGKVDDYKSKLKSSVAMNDVEAQILEGVARLYPDFFLQLDHFYNEKHEFQDEIITVFDREIQFYMGYLNFVNKFRQKGLVFCYPEVSAKTKEVFSHDGFDLALAGNLIREDKPVVVNDFYLRAKERILVVSGPNQGGKTTFARTFGQVHYLAAMGLPVPGRDAQLFHFNRLFTHFEKEENMKNLRGKLQDELYRIHLILKEITPGSILIINEIFTSTTLQDQIFLSKKILEKIVALDIVGVWVTFIDELASYNEKTVSMTSSVVPENPAQRTFKINRAPADGLAYALSVAEKYKLTYNSLKNRLNHASTPVI